VKPQGPIPSIRLCVSNTRCRRGGSKLLAALVVTWRSHDKERAYNHHIGNVMRWYGTDQTPACSFCQKELRAAKKLIRSPDGWTYICDECTLQPSRLRLEVDKSAARNDARSSLICYLSRILRHVWIGPTFRCSFCAKKTRFLRLFVSSFQFEIQSRICKGCLTACRQILKEEAESGRRSVASARDTPR
jgi:ClpX C4-type zinc finger protein